MKLFWTILNIFAILPLLKANWCGLPSCGNRTHIDCAMRNGVVPIPSFCKNAVMIDLSAHRTQIVQKHNTLRNQVAGGIFVNRAVRMGTLRWNDTFASLARKNVRKCTFTADECANTPNFKYVGQNIARAVYPKTSNKSDLSVMLQLIDMWFAENEVTDRFNLDYYPGSEWGADMHLRNYCQLVHELATRVGCGAMRYEEGNNYVLLFTCLYDSSNKYNWPVYVVGNTASKCKTGRNANYPNLCSVSETYKVNQYQQEYGPPYPV